MSEKYKIPPVLTWRGERVIPEARVCRVGFPPPAYMKTKGLFQEGKHWFRLRDDDLAVFMDENQDSLREMYGAGRGTLLKIRKSSYSLVTEKGFEEMAKYFDYRPYLQDYLTWLQINYFHPENSTIPEQKGIELKSQSPSTAQLLLELQKKNNELKQEEKSVSAQLKTIQGSLREIQDEKQMILIALKTILKESEKE